MASKSSKVTKHTRSTALKDLAHVRLKGKKRRDDGEAFISLTEKASSVLHDSIYSEPASTGGGGGGGGVSVVALSLRICLCLSAIITPYTLLKLRVRVRQANGQTERWGDAE